MKKIIMLLLGGFILLSIGVAVIPEITDVEITDNVSQIPAIGQAGLTLSQWLIPLAFVVGIVMVGVVALKRRR